MREIKTFKGMSKEEVAKIPQHNLRQDEIQLPNYSSPSTIISEIKEAVSLYGEEHIEFRIYDKYYDFEESSSPTASLFCSRFNTEEEQAEVDKKLARQKKDQEERDKREFERLSKVFGAK